MKIVYDNLAFSLQTAGGVSAVWAGLLQNIPDKYVYRYLEWNNRNIFNNNLNLNKSKIEHGTSFFPKLMKLAYAKVELKEKFIFHSSLYRISKNKNAINVVTVHDFIDKKFNPNLLMRSLRWYLMRRCLINSDAVVCVSKNTKQDLQRYLPTIEEDKIHIIYNGKSDAFFKLNYGNRSYDFVLFVGKRGGYKNFKTLIGALENDLSLKLKIVGGGKLTREELKILSKIGKDRYTYLGQISNDELNILYNEALCLVYPSIYEGFGIPIIEAQSAGCPVIAANRSSLPEVLGDSGILLDNLSAQSISSAIAILKNREMREKYVQLGISNAEKYSWLKMSEAYLKLYKTLWELT